MSEKTAFRKDAKNRGKPLYTLLKSYKDLTIYSGRSIRWLVTDDKGQSLYCHHCGNLANAAMGVRKPSGLYNIPLCKVHFANLFPKVEYAPAYEIYKPTYRLRCIDGKWKRVKPK